MTRIFFALALCFSLACSVFSSAALAENGYFSALPELPLPPLMQELPDSAVRFDQPEGRIITLQAGGDVGVNEIIDFYEKTLPELGWLRHQVAKDDAGDIVKGDKAYFTRDKEILFIEIKSLSNGSSRLNVLLRPL